MLRFFRRLSAVRVPQQDRRPKVTQPRLYALEDRLVPATLTVTTLASDNVLTPGTLRYELAHAPSGDTISFQSGLTGNLALTNGALVVTKSVDIQGPGANLISISGNSADRIFYIPNSANVTVTISGLTLKQGSAQTHGDGGGAISLGASNTLTLLDDVLTGNKAEHGGAIFTAGTTLTLQNCTLSGNSATLAAGGNYRGGALYETAGSLVRIQNSTISGNTAKSNGGGAFFKGNATIQNSTISGNSATNGAGGGVNFYDGQASIQNSTIYGNSAHDNAGGVLVQNANVTFQNCTITGNTSAATGGGLYEANVNGGTSPVVTLENTLLAGNKDGSGSNDATLNSGTLNASNSLIENLPGGTINGTNSNNIFGQDPLLGPLQNNGGPTQTEALLPGSPAIDAGSNAAAASLTTDQRGFARFVNGTVDLGAFEVQPTVQFSTAGETVSENAGTFGITVTLSAVANLNTTIPFTLGGTAVAGTNYSGVTPSPLVIAAGHTFGTISGTLIDDGHFESVNKTLTFTLGTPTNGTLGSPAVNTLTIIESDRAHTFFSFDRAFRLGERVARGNLDGDGDADLVVCAPGGRVTAFDGRTGRALFRFAPFGSQPYGLSVVLADVNHDGRDDLILAPRFGSGLVEVFSGRTLALLRTIDTGLPGVRLALGDVTGDGVPDLIAGGGAGPQGGRVRIFQGIGPHLVAQLRPYGKGYHGVIYVAAGDLTGDGIADVLTLTGGRLLRAFRGPRLTLLLRRVTPSATFLGGLRVPLG
jgi:FG-GAP-like repeat